MQELELGLGLIKQDDHYILQMRDHATSRGANNLVGIFGGKLEPGETPIAGTLRELREETNLQLTADQAISLGKVDVLSDHDNESALIQGHGFLFTIASGVNIESHEGTLVHYTEQDAFRNRFMLTPTARAFFEQLFFKDIM